MIFLRALRVLRGESSMSEQTINVAVVGLGFMGATHVAAYQAAAKAGYPCRLTAVVDPDPDRRAGKAVQQGNLDSGSSAAVFDPDEVAAYETLEAMLEGSDVDLVSICARTDLHLPLAETAMRAGKHVLLEKPVAITAEQVQTLADIAADCGVRCMPAMCMRFWPAWAWLKQAVDSGEFGALKTARFTRLGSRPGWSAFYADPTISGGALVDLHVHDADFIVNLLGAPTSVQSAGTLDHVTTLYAYPEVPHVVAEGGWDQQEGFGFTMRYVVNFEQATADFDIGRDPQLLLSRNGKAEPVEVVVGEPLTGYDAEIRHLIDCLAHDRIPAVDLPAAVVTHRVLDAERRSLETGAPVKL